MGRPSKLQLARRSASCRRADVRVWSKAASQSISLTLEILLEDVSQEDVAAHRRMVPVADKPMREARDPCTRRATRRASIRSRGPEASGRATQPHDARLGFRHHAAHPLGGGHHRIPDTVSITVARRLAMRWRHHLRYTVLAAVAFADEHTDGGTWRGASQPPRTAPPRHVPYIERECLAQIPPNVRA